MKTIHKFQLSSTKTELQIPVDARILTVQMQYGIPTAWVLLNPEEKRITRKVQVFGTGQQIENMVASHNYIATVQDGQWVWHIFEV